MVASAVIIVALAFVFPEATQELYGRAADAIHGLAQQFGSVLADRFAPFIAGH